MCNEKGNSLIMGIIIGFLIAGGLFAAYTLGTKTGSTTTQTNDVSPAPSLMTVTTPLPEADTLPEKWSLQKSSNCNIAIPLPPKEAPYITPNTTQSEMDSGAFWQIEERDNSADSQSLFKKSISTFYRNPNALGSGYIAGIVSVQCSTNTSGLSTDDLFKSYENWFNSLGNSDIVQISNKRVSTKWGRSVWEVYHKGGMYDELNPQYFFATPTHIYSINQTSMSQDSFVKETTNKIFENLTFQ